MSRRTGNNYSGPRWLYADKRKSQPSKPGESLVLSGSSRDRFKSSAPFTQEEMDAAIEPHVNNEGHEITR